MGVHRGEYDFKTTAIEALKHSEQDRLSAPEVEIVDEMENTDPAVHHKSLSAQFAESSSHSSSYGQCSASKEIKQPPRIVTNRVHRQLQSLSRSSHRAGHKCGGEKLPAPGQ
jgi:hypothetical protein